VSPAQGIVCPMETAVLQNCHWTVAQLFDTQKMTENIQSNQLCYALGRQYKQCCGEQRVLH
jgi:hypothetical protein